MKRRELCTVAAIAVLGTAQQLHSHLRGALNTGATREEIEAVLALIEPDLDPEHKRRGGGGGGGGGGEEPKEIWGGGGGDIWGQTGSCSRSPRYHPPPPPPWGGGPR